MEHTGIEYILTWFHKEGDDDFLVDKCILQDISLDRLSELFNQPPEEKMIHCYPVRYKHLEYLQRFTNHKIDLNEYDYFVEGQQTD